MPPTPSQVRRAAYPRNGWSSWYGGDAGNPYPAAKPYGMFIEAPGSTGIFDPFNGGVKFLVPTVTTTSSMQWKSTFQPPVSILPATVTMNYLPPAVKTINIIYYIEGGAPLFVYQQTFTYTWPNMRKKYTFVGPGVAPLPLLSRIGPLVTITPLNRRGFDLWS